MLTLDPETQEHWLADSEEDLGEQAVILAREPFKPGVVRFHVVWPQLRDFRLVYLAERPEPGPEIPC